MSADISSLDSAIAASEKYAQEQGLFAKMGQGALVAYSGGADSAFLLHAAVRWGEKYGFPVYAAHVHHGIRGEEADRDLSHCEEVCRALSVPLSLCRADVPRLAKEKGIGLEACAREVRFAFLRKEAERLGASAILVAHNASDQAETVLFHLLRGSGLRGLCGMHPWKDGIARPLLSLYGEEIRAALRSAGISYVEDSTNRENDASRNYLRHEVMPRLSKIVPDPTRAICRAAENLAEDQAFLEGQARILAEEATEGDALLRSRLREAPDAIAVRVLAEFCEKRLPPTRYPEKVHLDRILRLLRCDRSHFSVDLPGGGRLFCDRERVSIVFEEEKSDGFSVLLRIGENVLPDGSILYIGSEKNKDVLEKMNVYKLFIQAKLSSATIENGCVARSRRPSDSYRVGGHRRSLKKLLNEAKIPLLLRRRLPILEDGEGIVWAPFLKVRDGEDAKDSVTVSYFMKE